MTLTLLGTWCKHWLFSWTSKTFSPWLSSQMTWRTYGRCSSRWVLHYLYLHLPFVNNSHLFPGGWAACCATEADSRNGWPFKLDPKPCGTGRRCALDGRHSTHASGLRGALQSQPWPHWRLQNPMQQPRGAPTVPQAGQPGYTARWTPPRSDLRTSSPSRIKTSPFCFFFFQSASTRHKWLTHVAQPWNLTMLACCSRLWRVDRRDRKHFLLLLYGLVFSLLVCMLKWVVVAVVQLGSLWCSKFFWSRLPLFQSPSVRSTVRLAQCKRDLQDHENLPVMIYPFFKVLMLRQSPFDLSPVCKKQLCIITRSDCHVRFHYVCLSFFFPHVCFVIFVSIICDKHLSYWLASILSNFFEFEVIHPKISRLLSN